MLDLPIDAHPVVPHRMSLAQFADQAAQAPQEYERLRAWYERVKLAQRHADEHSHPRERN